MHITIPRLAAAALVVATLGSGSIGIDRTVERLSVPTHAPNFELSNKGRVPAVDDASVSPTWSMTAGTTGSLSRRCTAAPANRSDPAFDAIHIDEALASRRPRS